MEMIMVETSRNKFPCGDQKNKMFCETSISRLFFASQVLKQTHKELQGCCFDLHLCQIQPRTRHRDPAGHCHKGQWTAKHMIKTLFCIFSNDKSTENAGQSGISLCFPNHVNWTLSSKGCFQELMFSIWNCPNKNNGEWLLDKMPLLRPYVKP